MKTNSFRLKIALLSALVSGGLLLVAGAVLWERTYQVELARIDREIRNLGTPHLERIVGGDHWVRFEGALRFVAGTNAAPAFILWVKHEDRVIHQSPHWPKEILPEGFPALTTYEAPDGPKPGEPLPRPPRREEPISVQNPALPRKAPQFYTREADGKDWRIGVMGNPYVTLILGADINEFNAGMAQLRRAYFATLPVALLLVAAGAWLIASRALRPVTALTQTAERITARGLDQRITVRGYEAEFARLITVFNQMMDRLEKGFNQATRFSADASHELKTPLTILQGELEQALQAAEPGSEIQHTYSRLLDEIVHLRAIADKLLLLSQADAGRLPLRCERVDLSRVLADIIEDVHALGPELTVESEIEPDVCVQADSDLIQRVLQNLAANAVKFNREGGRVRLELHREGDNAVLRIANTGVVIPPADRERIFERFYRTAQARESQAGGVGLGLSLAREIIRAHNGDITLEPTRDDLTEFVVQLPLARG
ncbi:MAG: HAMP domain-containing protein [Verrucomicrobia bacterium]|nr:HAMP domain-containing protein [Verrucomicrobiota bacterium]